MGLQPKHLLEVKSIKPLIDDHSFGVEVAHPILVSYGLNHLKRSHLHQFRALQAQVVLADFQRVGDRGFFKTGKANHTEPHTYAATKAPCLPERWA